MIERGRVVQIISGKYSVKVGKTTRILTARGKLKRGGATIAVGDEVEFDGEVIEKVLPRKNYLSRPSVANVDIAVIVAAPLPETDLYLVDKFISCCFLAGVKCVIAVNKSDESTSPLSLIYENYSSVVEKIFSISAKTKEGLGNFVSFLKGKTAVFSGQSAVGKTSILNAVTGENNLVGELSEKTKKGKQTTTSSLLYEYGEVTIIDTPGFSALDLSLPKEILASTYPDFIKYAYDCRFGDCKHIDEPDCAVKAAVEEGKISKDRYIRYKKIYGNSKEVKNYARKN